MLAALSWVPRGAPITKVPQGVTDDADEMEVVPQPEDANGKETDNAENGNGVTSAEEDGNSEADIDEVLANELDSLAFHKRGEKDPYLAGDADANEIFDEEELEDLNMKPTDSLIVTVKPGEDASTMEIHVFDDDPNDSDEEEGPYVPHTYVHHDVVLPSIPLCTAYTQLEMEGEAVNLVAVGMFTPGIDVWDVDRVNYLEPVASLGGYGEPSRAQSALSAASAVPRGTKAKRKKRKPKLRLKEGSHSDAVMSLSWNMMQREYLASGSADTTVKVWDVESSHCACTLQHHTGKVQCVAFHPSEAHLLATGSFDRTVKLVDVRAATSAKGSWSLQADVETCQWGFGPTDGLIIATTEDGSVRVFDSRKEGGSSLLCSWSAHDGAAPACSVSHEVAGLMVTAGVDKTVKVWDIQHIAQGRAGDLVYQKRSNVGSLFSLSLCPKSIGQDNASPFIVAYGGSKGVLTVSDLAVESDAVRERFASQCSEAASTSIGRRAVRSKRWKQKSRKASREEESEEDCDEDDEFGGGDDDDDDDDESDDDDNENSGEDQ